MKSAPVHVCIVAGRPDHTLVLAGLTRQLHKENSIYLTRVSTRTHYNPEMTIACRRLEEEGFTVEEESRIRLESEKAHQYPEPFHFGALEYDALLQRLQPDLVLVYGQSHDSFTAAVAATQSGIPIAHVQDGKSAYHPQDPAFGYGIARLARLHFTATPAASDAVADLGRDPARIFTVGSLVKEQAARTRFQSREAFCSSAGLDPASDFFLVCFQADSALGSANSGRTRALLDGLEHYVEKGVSLLFAAPGRTGLDGMVTAMMDTFCHRFPEQCAMAAEPDAAFVNQALHHCALALGDSSGRLRAAGIMKTAVVNVGIPDENRTGPDHVVDCPAEKNAVCSAIETALSDDFAFTLQNLLPGNTDTGAAGRICRVLSEFRPEKACPGAGLP